MKKLVIITIGLILLSFNFNINSQIKFGLSTGLSSTNILFGHPYDNSNFKSNPKTGFCFETDISREIEDYFLLQAGISFNHMKTNGQISDDYDYVYQYGDYTINSCNIIFSPAIGIKKIGLYLLPGIHIGYSDCKFSGIGYENFEFYPIPKHINEVLFSGFYLGYSLELRIQREILDKFDVFIGAGLKNSLTSYNFDAITIPFCLANFLLSTFQYV